MNNKSFKIAVVSDNGSTVSQHFGSANFYEVFTVEEGKIIHSEQRQKTNVHQPGLQHMHNFNNPNINHDPDKPNNFETDSHQINAGQGGHNHGAGHGGHNHGAMISNIADCEFLIARGMGYGIYNHLESANIKPIVTNIRLINDAILAVIDGTIVNYTQKLH